MSVKFRLFTNLHWGDGILTTAEKTKQLSPTNPANFVTHLPWIPLSPKQASDRGDFQSALKAVEHMLDALQNVTTQGHAFYLSDTKKVKPTPTLWEPVVVWTKPHCLHFVADFAKFLQNQIIIGPGASETAHIGLNGAAHTNWFKRLIIRLDWHKYRPKVTINVAIEIINVNISCHWFDQFHTSIISSTIGP